MHGFNMIMADQLLESHPYLRLESWLGFARKHAGTTQDKDDWERNARQLITTWGPPVNDYSCRVWSGLIRDFYVPRMRALTDAMAKGEPFNRAPWEAQWVQSLGISKVAPLKHPAVQAAAWVNEAFATTIPSSYPPT